MAIPVHFREVNLVLGPPGGAEDEEVALLPTYQDAEAGRLVSCWELSEQEKALVARTGRVWLSVEGRTDHPVALVTGIKSKALRCG